MCGCGSRSVAVGPPHRARCRETKTWAQQPRTNRVRRRTRRSTRAASQQQMHPRKLLLPRLSSWTASTSGRTQAAAPRSTLSTARLTPGPQRTAQPALGASSPLSPSQRSKASTSDSASALSLHAQPAGKQPASAALPTNRTEHKRARFTCNELRTTHKTKRARLDQPAHKKTDGLVRYTPDRLRFTKFQQARPTADPPPGPIQTSYPPQRVRNSRAPESAFLSAVSGENVQRPQHAQAVVHDLSTAMTGCPESDFSCSDSETRTWSITVQAV